jgi:hypothetical protein
MFGRACYVNLVITILSEPDPKTVSGLAKVLPNLSKVQLHTESIRDLDNLILILQVDFTLELIFDTATASATKNATHLKGDCK